MRVFGFRVPFDSDFELVATPVGSKCIWCDEPIAEGDCGYLIAPRPHHRCCFYRSLLGSLGHQLGECSCFGGDREDPPGLTRKQAAEAAWFYNLASTSPTALRVDRHRVMLGLEPFFWLDAKSAADAQHLRNTLHDGIAALQSLDDLGEELNQLAFSFMQLLLQRHAALAH